MMLAHDGYSEARHIGQILTLRVPLDQCALTSACEMDPLNFLAS
jgi:hypothetical protein